MNRFGRGNGTGGFAALLRSAKGFQGIQRPANNLQAGAKPEMGGSTQRRPNDKATTRHMEAKDTHGSHRGRRGSGAAAVTSRTPKLDPENRIARGPVGTTGRVIHHKPIKERKGSVPGHISIGPHRSGSSSKKLSSSGKTRMSKEVSLRPGVPAHISVINRSSRTRDLAHSIHY